jgi:proteasome beta subunit
MIKGRYTMDNELKNSVLKTGTTILGIVCKDGIVMASDRQVSAGTMVMKKNKEKTTKINEYLLYSGAGLASAVQRVAKILGAELRLKELRSKTRPTVRQAASLAANMIYQNIRQFTRIEDVVGALIGGFNEDGSFELYTLDPSGHIDIVDDYDANYGSGMPFSLGLLERQFRKGMSVKEGVEVAKDSLLSSTQRDMGSGYGIDIYTITKEGIKKVFETELKAELKAK